MTAAKVVRDKEAKDLSNYEVDLVNFVDTLQRAISFFQRSWPRVLILKKGIDTQNMSSVEAPLTVVDTAAFSSVDKHNCGTRAEQTIKLWRKQRRTKRSS